MKFLFTRFLVNGLLFLPFFLNRENFIQDDIGCILLAHKLDYSAAVTDPAPGLAAARTAYPAAVAGYDGLTEELEFDREP